MLIRPAHKDDLPDVARIHVDTWHSTYTGIAPQSHLDSLTYSSKEEMWLLVLSPEHPTTLLVAESERGIAGFVSVGPEQGNTGNGELFTLYISDNVQRSGVGTALFQAGAAELRKRGFGTMILWVLEGNTKGIAFYEKMGGRMTQSKAFELVGVELTEFCYEFSLIVV